MVIHPGGTNISHGQRQLVCLARALLAHCRLLILDEATSAIDSITDAAIQKIIRKEFSEATVIVITHKLANVADFDALLVLADGKVAGFGPPAEIMANGGTGLGPE
ncbi:ABC transporter domain-containing protein [Purpureocillium lilacinum]|uniref:ABC transporter domain-containing protein n=1 Tax=Purpureocillium lilacinum TaxID=33203 RepID=A0A179GZ70_PURLI|nr:ABC transporter domain-containing protein [Purpureocillium lilacinum]OAQ82583.1 ABC transporter domain-containing protein [Purpureocillium lilacinum]